MRTISSNNIPIKIWGKNVMKNAIKQAEKITNFDFVFKHIALMPDAHYGMFVPIGTVLATKDIVIPYAVGVDIGCGMATAITSGFIQDISSSVIDKIVSDIRIRIPRNNKKHKRPQAWVGFNNPPNINIIKRELYKTRKQLGTLGGGNHFIEIQKDSLGRIWVMVHSGSRHLGLQVANYYNEVALKLNLKKDSKYKKYQKIIKTFGKNETGILFSKSKLGLEYLEAMQFCFEFAYRNRFHMLEQIRDIFLDHTKIKFEKYENVSHNYASIENHFGEEVVLHRKGAIKAGLGELGIIPGSQGTASYIVKGLGNPESFCSCSHGAGRTMSRKAAKERLDIKLEKMKLDNLGIKHSMNTKKNLDEAPGAYKNIEEVIASQSDLIKIIEKLEPLAVIKG